MMTVHGRENLTIERDFWIMCWIALDFDEKITSAGRVAEDVDDFRMIVINVRDNGGVGTPNQAD
jgi:hypothetical protein